MAELVDIHQEFHLGNRYILDVATELSSIISEDYRVIVKYDIHDLPDFGDHKKNIIFATSRELHGLASDVFEKNVFRKNNDINTE